MIERLCVTKEQFVERMRDKNTPLPKTDAKLVELEYLVMENLGFVVIDKQELSLLSEKERTLRKLLENRPKSEDYPIAYIIENTEKVIAHRKAVEQWFGVFVGEFEGLKKILGSD